MLPGSRKKNFNSANVIPAKLRLCNECNDKLPCNRCNTQVNEIKKFDAFLNSLKRQAPNEFILCFLITYVAYLLRIPYVASVF